MLDPVVIVVALIAGLLFKRAGFPPLLGYLASGFVLYGMGMGVTPTIEALADLGITLLLFTIGLKLNLKDLTSVRVWTVTGLHMVISIGLVAGLLMLLSGWLSALQGIDIKAIWTVAFALSFSSTVLAVKIFEEQGETAALYAKMAIAILIAQDLIAVFFMAASTGKIPDASALLLLLLIPCRPLLHRLLLAAGHGELMILFGFAMAVGGAALFEFFYVKGDLGALIVGVLLGSSPKSTELAKGLLNIKDLFLVGFFLMIGLNGLPEPELVLVAVVLGVAIVFKPVLYYLLMISVHLRARTSLLTALALFNYSEFGLIVAGVAAGQGLLSMDWVTTMALALAISFFLSVPVNARAVKFYNNYQHLFNRVERNKRLPEESRVNIGDVDIMVLGLGRVGSGAYQYLQRLYPNKVVGIEESAEKIRKKTSKGFNVVRGDVSDRDFWDGINLQKIELIMISLTNHTENVAVVKLLNELNYQGKLAVIARFPDEQKQLESLGCISYNFYAEAGHGFAEHVFENSNELTSSR